MSSPAVGEIAAASQRRHWARIGAWAAAASLAWNVVEAAVALWAAALASSVALLGFGVDSGIETASAAIAWWRLAAERRGDAARAERAERLARRPMAVLLVLLAVYLVVEAVRRLAGVGPEARESLVGLALTAVSVVIMPALFLVKRRVARELNSAAVRADGIQTLVCLCLSLATFAGLALNAWRGWTWADPVAGLLLVPLIAKEAHAAWRGKPCAC